MTYLEVLEEEPLCFSQCIGSVLSAQLPLWAATLATQSSSLVLPQTFLLKKSSFPLVPYKTIQGQDCDGLGLCHMNPSSPSLTHTHIGTHLRSGGTGYCDWQPQLERRVWNQAEVHFFKRAMLLLFIQLMEIFFLQPENSVICWTSVF